MAEILCPVCGKANPEELEICQYCGTLLKNRGTEPLPPIRPGALPTSKKTSELESTLPGWLRNIRKGDADEDAAGVDNAENPAPTFSTPKPTRQEAPKNKSESPLDLLAGLSQSNEEEDEVPDWLASLKSNMPAGPVPSPEPTATESQPAEQSQQPADWLAGLQIDSQPEQPAPAGQPATNWGLESEPASFQEAEEPATQFSDETSDWLNSLSTQDENSKTSVQPTPTAPPLGTESSSEEEAPSAGDLPDWLASLGNESTQQTSPPPEPAGSSSDVFPAVTIPSESAPSEPAPAGDLPDWLAGLGSESELSGQATLPSEPSSGESIPAPVSEEPPVPADLAPSGDLPDWLTTAIGEKASETPPADSSPAKAFSTGALEELGPLGGTADLPDWMAGLGTSTAPASETPLSEPEQSSFAQEQPAPPDADTLDWLSGMAEAGAKPPETESEPAGEAPAESTIEKPETTSVSFDMPAAETATASSVPAAENEQNLDSILSMDMPDWLSGFAPTESEPAKARNAPAGAAPADAEDISPANLPSWVQAMRPMEAVISGTAGDEEDQNIEKEGPLAGLRSVLPGQTGALGPHKPKAYSIKLQVDPTQQAQAALLENLIASEAESHPISTPQRIMNIRPLRWAIAGVLLLMVLIPALTGPTGLFPAPFVQPNGEIHLFQQKIDALPANAAVLVAFDYQPGYAGEMEQAAGPVIANLVQKNVRMVFISTSPMGTLLSERVMAQHTSYKLNEQYINLGYLPGDAAGVQVFATDPYMLGNDYRRSESLWIAVDPDPKNKKFNSLGDFQATLVLTDNPDIARLWIEQTSQVRSPDKPMLMILSAQAEPMIRPYRISGQIQGMFSGLAGATAYQQANSYWDSYAAGMMAAELLIIFGGLWALVENLRARRAAQHADEEDEA